MRKLLIGLALSLAAASAQAQWVLVTKSDQGDAYYVDPTTKTRKGNIVRIWGLQDYLKPEVVLGKAIYSDRVYRQYDCAERTSQTLQSNGFLGQMGSGDVVASRNQPGDIIFVAPRTVFDSLLNFACK